MKYKVIVPLVLFTPLMALAQGGQVRVGTSVGTGAVRVSTDSARVGVVAVDMDLTVMNSAYNIRLMTQELQRLRLTLDSLSDRVSAVRVRDAVSSDLLRVTRMVRDEFIRLDEICPPEAAERTAMLGVRYLAPGGFLVSRARPADTIVVNYPLIEMVYPGTPAARSGLMPLDSIMNIDGLDMRGRTLEAMVDRPGRTLAMVIRRDGTDRRIEVELAPNRSACSVVLELPEIQTARIIAGGQAGVVSGGRASFARSGSDSSAGGTIRRVQVRAGGTGRTTDILVTTTPTMGGAEPVALPLFGAIFWNAPRDMARDGAVLVTTVGGNSIALRSGLGVGDMVVQADSIAVRRLSDLLRAVETSAGSIRLELLRNGKPQTIVLNWK